MNEVDKRIPGVFVCPNGCETVETVSTPIGAELACPTCDARAPVAARIGSLILAKQELVDVPLAPAVRRALDATTRPLYGSDDTLVVLDEASGVDDAVFQALSHAAPRRVLSAQRPLTAAERDELVRRWNKKFGAPAPRTAVLREFRFDSLRDRRRERRSMRPSCGANPHHLGASACSAFMPGSAWVEVCNAPGCNWFAVFLFHQALAPERGPLALCGAAVGEVDVTRWLSGHMIVTGAGGAELAGQEKARVIGDHFERVWGSLVTRRLDEHCPDEPCTGRLVVHRVDNAWPRTGAPWQAVCDAPRCNYSESGVIVDGSRTFSDGELDVRLGRVRGVDCDPVGEFTLTVRGEG